MAKELLLALEQLEKERGIDKEIIIAAIEEGIEKSYAGDIKNENVKVVLNREDGNIEIFERKIVVEEVTDPKKEISLEEAREIDPEFEIGEEAEFDITTTDFKRTVAQQAKQIIIQKLREEERSMILDQFTDKLNNIVSGTIQRVERRDAEDKVVYLDLGKTEAVLPQKEQVPSETYRFGERIKVYVLDVKKTNKEPKIIVSRTHPALVKKLFELEIPEIADGTVEIMSLAREAGSRSKLAVYSENEDIEPVGACVGQKGTRVQVIVDELKGERIDVVKWSDDPTEFIGSSLSPAKVVSVEILDEEEKTAEVIVPDAQLSLAIGKEGQNVRLAAKLTGWKIDIKSESQAREEELSGETDEPLFKDDVDSEEATEETAPEAAEETAEEVTDEAAPEEITEPEVQE